MTERRAGESNRRSPKFREVLSLFMVRVGAVGAFLVLIDPKLIVFGDTLQLGSGFSADLKGAVIASILISGYAAVKEYWLGASATGQNQAESMSRIAEASASSPTNGKEVKADDVNVTAKGDVTVTKGKKK